MALNSKTCQLPVNMLIQSVLYNKQKCTDTKRNDNTTDVILLFTITVIFFSE